MDLSTLVETSKAFEEHVVRGDDPLRAHGGVAIIRKNPYLSAAQSLPMLTIVQVVHGCCKGSWSYGPITVLIWSPSAMFGFYLVHHPQLVHRPSFATSFSSHTSP